jgi:hypothetical protein
MEQFTCELTIAISWQGWYDTNCFILTRLNISWQLWLGYFYIFLNIIYSSVLEYCTNNARYTRFKNKHGISNFMRHHTVGRLMKVCKGIVQRSRVPLWPRIEWCVTDAYDQCRHIHTSLDVWSRAINADHKIYFAHVEYKKNRILTFTVSRYSHSYTRIR